MTFVFGRVLRRYIAPRRSVGVWIGYYFLIFLFVPCAVVALKTCDHKVVLAARPQSNCQSPAAARAEGQATVWGQQKLQSAIRNEMLWIWRQHVELTDGAGKDPEALRHFDAFTNLISHKLVDCQSLKCFPWSDSGCRLNYSSTHNFRFYLFPGYLTLNIILRQLCQITQLLTFKRCISFLNDRFSRRSHDCSLIDTL